MSDCGAFHRPFHRARSAAGTDIQLTQSHLVADTLGVFVLDTRNRMPAPAHHQIRCQIGLQHISIAQGMKHQISQRHAIMLAALILQRELGAGE